MTNSDNQDQPGLFSPLRLGALTLPHRVVMAPLTRNRAGPGFVPRAMNVAYYRQRASAGLIISEATQVTPEGLGYPDTPGIHSPEQVAGWRRVTDAVHAAGGRMYLQLWHVGRISHPSLQPEGKAPVAPSAIRPEGEAMTYDGPRPFETPRALDAGEIPDVIAQYRRGAENARAAGFDGVEVHNANGYLLDQFLRDGSNRRTDAYGGSVDNRMRLPLEVLEAVLGVWPADRVGIRLSPSGTMNDMRDSDPRTTFGSMIRALDEYDLAYLHLMEPMESDRRHGSPAIPTREFRPLYHGNLLVNAEYDGPGAQAAIADGHADAVAFGRSFLANPDLPERLRRGAALNEPDPATFYGGDERGYIDYPALAEAAAV
ncbi:alkene reductase [Salinisphaera orenii]|uniref:12-oxophytodienoate reductase n=1 Tax=Salinisphaera orenii YIM 95161 TaxID=1051139 RepID=A0A423PGH9_9GAMM|nr:alkene reductase [Salinisphaera halophila]ROO24586.1 12-oxophytodienoate reductase [Salinisphaera halophila YIM 95161]